MWVHRGVGEFFFSLSSTLFSCSRCAPASSSGLYDAYFNSSGECNLHGAGFCRRQSVLRVTRNMPLMRLVAFLFCPLCVRMHMGILWQFPRTLSIFSSFFSSSIFH
ncbi:hypothetical protein B0H19DRAFT_1145776, partial [Mycena capillaripes]